MTRWECPTCGNINSGWHGICLSCGKPRPVAIPLENESVVVLEQYEMNIPIN